MDSSKQENNKDLYIGIGECFRLALGKDFQEVDLIKLEFKVAREWDSLSHIKLMANLRDKFSIKLSFEDMVKMTSYSEVLRIVSSHLQR